MLSSQFRHTSIIRYCILNSSSTVVTETWSLSYKSAIEEKTTRRDFELSQEAEAEAEATDNLTASSRNKLQELHSLPDRLDEAVQDFNEHARYFMVSPKLILRKFSYFADSD